MDLDDDDDLDDEAVITDSENDKISKDSQMMVMKQ